MYIIGLTGGIASGKSSVARILTTLGAPVVDADQLAREAVAPGKPPHEAIVAAFGRELLLPDGSINRPRLGKIVFANPDARRTLEEITHPAIRRHAAERLEALQREGNHLAFYMAPLLFEAGASFLTDEVWVVYVDPDTQLARLMDRDGCTREDAQQRIAAQMPMEEKKELGQVVIDNRGSLGETEVQVREEWRRLLFRLKDETSASFT